MRHAGELVIEPDVFHLQLFGPWVTGFLLIGAGPLVPLLVEFGHFRPRRLLCLYAFRKRRKNQIGLDRLSPEYEGNQYPLHGVLLMSASEKLRSYSPDDL